MDEAGLFAYPLTALTGVGATLSARLAKLGLHTVQDLLFHLPSRYEDKTKLYRIADLTPNMSATIEGEVVSSQVILGRRRVLTCRIADKSGSLTLLFFHFTSAMKNGLQPGQRIKVYGEAKRGKKGLEIIHPEYRLIADDATIALNTTLTPIYPTTEKVGQHVLRKLTQQALQLLANTTIDEVLPPSLAQSLIAFPVALQTLHHPEPDSSLSLLEKAQHPAQRRLIFEELLAHTLSLLVARAATDRHRAYPLGPATALIDRFLAALPFQPTPAQYRVIQDIAHDLAKSVPMMRLVQGDVGSGKTLVAAFAALMAINQHYQVALMAPTELLAEQHVENFRRWFTPLGIEVGWLVGKQKGKARQVAMTAIAEGKVQIVIGTHALFQEPITFKQLGLIIIDEQHRFGVHQRLMLWEKGATQNHYPHQLIMTATPIPRTLAMTAYADLDTSIIDELPPGRTPVTTVAIADSRRDEVIVRVKQACLHEGRQAYWVCTLIDESEVLEAQAAEATLVDLQQALPELTISMVHGRMKPAEKQAIMHAFKQGEIQLLVATTVIEVGVDVPNASLMIIEDPERLGLSQLHQLRGRVGRGAVVSHCVLLYKSPLSQTARQRLQVLRDSNDGFIIAQRDLEIRGPGELLGTRQTGCMAFKIADLLRDNMMIDTVHHTAHHLLHNAPEKAHALIARWLPEKSRYSNA